MKIIHVCPRFYPDIGGIETHVREIAKRMAKDNEVMVYTTDPTGKLDKEQNVDGIEVRRFKSFAPSDSGFFSPSLEQALRKERCDILHAHCFQAFPSYQAGAAKQGVARKLIFTPHFHPRAATAFRNFLRIFYDRLQRKTFSKADRIICVSDYEANAIKERFNIPMEKISVIPNGVDMSKFEGVHADERDGTFRILYVGRLERYKRVHWILGALAKLKAKHPEMKAQLIIIGRGPFEQDLKEKTVELDLEDVVVFKSGLGDAELAKEYMGCSVFVMPSEYEAFNISTLEALSCKKPVIVSNAGPLPEMANGSGYVITSEDELEQKLLLVSQSKVEVNFDLKKYSWDSIAEQTARVYGG